MRKRYGITTDYYMFMAPRHKHNKVCSYVVIQVGKYTSYHGENGPLIKAANRNSPEVRAL